MQSNVCSMCEIEKHIKIFHKKNSDYKICNSKRGLERYYDNKKKISSQRETYYGKIKDHYTHKMTDIYNLKNY